MKGLKHRPIESFTTTQKVSEAKERIALLGKFINLEHAVDGLKDMVTKEAMEKENIAHQLNKALSDLDMWRKNMKWRGWLAQASSSSF
jgi:hypothetical protein